MNEPNDSHLSATLSSMTEWNGPETAVWRDALVKGGQEAPKPMWRLGSWRALGALAAVVAILACGLVASRIGSGPESGPNRGRAELAVASATPSLVPWKAPADSDTVFESSSRSSGFARDSAQFGDIPILADAFTQPAYEVWSSGTDAPDRAILRESSMSLAVDDVRAAFAAASSLVDTLAGEFVESGALTGEGESARANLALRISTERLDAVMQGARRLGDVTLEQTNASDVTDRLSDLGAQVRNERRIEAELLGLLDSRPDAPLADILKVRQSLDEVRLKIERIEAQRAGLSKRVALSLLRIDFAPKLKDEPEPEPEGASFLNTMRDAFGRGGDALGESIAWTVEVVIGGLAIWLPLTVVGVWADRALRWRATWA